MRGVNEVTLIGNLGADPDVRHTPNGTPVANLNLATDESYKDKATGQIVPKTEWHRLVAFKRLAEICGEYLKKGSLIYVKGSLQTRKWQDQSGQDRYTTEIRVDEMRMLDGRPDKAGAPQPTQQPAPQAQQAAPVDGFDDDIPY